MAEMYMKRNLAFPRGVLPAFLGVPNSLRYETHWKFRNGMPDNISDIALLSRLLEAGLNRSLRAYLTVIQCLCKYIATPGQPGLGPSLLEVLRI